MAGEVRHSPHAAQDSATTSADNECPFCDRIAMRRDLLGANSLCIAFYDTKPLNPGHVPIAPYRHEPDFSFPRPERNAILRMAVELRSQLDEEFRRTGQPRGNVGGAVGQTIGHAHHHPFPATRGTSSSNGRNPLPDPRADPLSASGETR